jgi:hypothetical protein
MSVRIAIKPKYPTRKATDKVLFNEGNFIDCIEEHSTRQLLSLLDTAHVALISEDGKYYPVNKDNYEEQYKLADAGETPTVEVDEKFGVKKIEDFISAPVDSEVANKLQEVSIYNGIISGKLFKVTDYTTIGEEKITKNGFWLAFNYDKTGAEAEGYSEAHLLMASENLEDGINFLFMGETNSLVNNTIIAIQSKLTVDETTGDNLATFENSLTGQALIAADDVAPIEVNGIAYEDLASAMATGEVVNINKSITVPKAIRISGGKSVYLNLVNGAVVTIATGYFMVNNGSLTVTGNGTIKEATPYLGPVIVKNNDENLSSSVYIGEGITLEGWAGLFFDSKSYNLHGVCKGHLIGRNDGSDDGSGFYVNGNVQSGDFEFSGSTEGTEGLGMYIAGNLKNTITGANIEGSAGGIEIRAGSLDISNSVVKSLKADEYTMVPCGNGATSTGVALAVAQHTTKKDMVVSVNNCTLTGAAAFMEGNPQKNPDCTKQMNIAITGNTVLNGKTLTLDPENDCKNFVYEARSSEEIDEKYIAKNYESTKEFTGSYTIASKQ